jgi:hypothetical protein
LKNGRRIDAHFFTCREECFHICNCFVFENLTCLKIVIAKERQLKNGMMVQIQNMSK